tara:strand:+ start:1836 stop:2084 length:249 start_codon:yes stop_codon:yes gene_type:complete
MLISGWYEGEYDAVHIAVVDAIDAEGLALSLFEQHGDDCVGVDMELDGEYLDGTCISTSMTEVFAELDYISTAVSLLQQLKG